MRRVITSLVVFVVAACALLAGVSGANAASEKASYYLSVGDSLAQGYQPIGGADERWSSGISFTHGYADQLFKLVRDRYTQLRLVKLGCYEETTQTMIDGKGSRCTYPAGSQLKQAEQLLSEHRGEVALVTIDIGVNDVRFEPDPIATVGTNLPQILTRLRAAAGPGVPIIGMNYFAGVSPVWAETHDLAAVQAQVALTSFLNYGFLGPIYAAAGDPVADVWAAFQAGDTTLVNGTPRDVLTECELTWLCTKPPRTDIHPNTQGYGVIAHAFEEVLP